MTDIYTRANKVTVESYFDDIEWDSTETLASPTTDPTLSTGGTTLNGASQILIVADVNTATTYDLIPWFYFADGPGWVPFPSADLEGLTGKRAIVARVGKAFDRYAFTLANEDGSVDVTVGRSIS